MPEWFHQVLEKCESLSLDSKADRERLWIEVQRGIDGQLAKVYLRVASGAAPVSDLPNQIIEEMHRG